MTAKFLLRPPRLVSVAGRRSEIEIGFEAAQGECGLDQYEVSITSSSGRSGGACIIIAFSSLTLEGAAARLLTLRKYGCSIKTGIYDQSDFRSSAS
jgi:hypothetical protein